MRKTSSLSAFLLLLLICPVSATDFLINATTLTPVYIGQAAHMPLQLWLILLALAVFCFFISLPLQWYRFTDMTSAISFLLFSVLAATAFFLESWSYETAIIQLNESAELLIQPVGYQWPGWISLLMFLMALLSLIQIYRVHLIILEETSPKIPPRKEGDKL